jgi:hypothetical protein
VATNCIEVEERLEGYLGQALGGAEAAALERHLQTCAACRRSLALERELLAVSATDPVPASAAVAWTEVRRWRESETAGELLGRIYRLRQAAAAALVFRVLIDPWLQVEHQLRIALLPVRQVLVQLGDSLTRVATAAGRQLAEPLLAAGRQIYSPIALPARLLQGG